MESQKPNNFEEEWQRAFNDTSVSPPSDMWDKIERELEEKKRRPFLFFIRPSAMIAGVAAALILVLGGLFFFNKKISDSTSVAVNTNSIQNTPKSKNQSQQDILDESNTKEQALSEAPSVVLGAAPSGTISYNYQEKSERKSAVSKKAKNKNQDILARLSLASTSIPTHFSDESIAVSAINPENNHADIVKENTDIQDITTKSTSFQEAKQTLSLVSDLSQLKYKNYQYLGSRYTLYRNKLVFDAEIEETPVLVSTDSKFWLGLQSGVSPFNPNMKLGDLNTVALAQADAFAKASNSPPVGVGSTPSTGDKQEGSVAVSQPQNAIKSGTGTNMGFAFGYKISKKWNLESGIKYLRGNSILQSNTYAFQQNGYVNTFLGDYLLQNATNNDLKIASNPINTVVADNSQFGNRYEYLMIPMQLGYEIGLTKKLGLNLLAGVSTDIFLQNTITNDNSLLKEKNIINGSSNVYKPLNISGLGGIRASYLISNHWQATLGSSFQQSLFSGINTSTALQMRIRMFGINYGINYRF